MERHPLFAAIYDPLIGVLERLLASGLRERTVATAKGRVLEIGVGTGLNLPLYREARSVTGIEPDPEMLRRARSRSAEARCPVTLVAAGGQALPFPDGSFDTVVASLVFCTIPDAAGAAREVTRVLAPGGKLHFFEHVRAPGARAAGFQDAITPGWKRLFAGCHPNRETLPLLESAGLRVDEKATTFAGILVVGTARAA